MLPTFKTIRPLPPLIGRIFLLTANTRAWQRHADRQLAAALHGDS